MKPVSFTDPTDIFRNEFVRLYSVQANFGSYTKEYFVTEKGVRVGILLFQNDSVLLVRQYRFLINDYSWEIPGGGIHPGESPERAARRECCEEAGIVCHSLIPLFGYALGLDVTDSHVHLFYSTEFSDRGELSDNNETDAREWVPLEECLQRVMTGEIKDLMTIFALLMCGYRKNL